MNRRDVIIGLGITGVAGSFVGTGAFTATTANRELSVEVTGDDSASLRLRELGDGGRSAKNGPEVEFSFPVGGSDTGLGSDSVYEFDRDASETGQNSLTLGLLRIENHGTQPVKVYSTHSTDSSLEVELYDVTDPDRLALSDDPPVLNVGESVDVGFRIRTYGTAIGTYRETIEIVAQAA
jgi:hypothetical protein